MRGLLALLLIAFLVFVGIGFYLDWFNFSVNRDTQGNARGVSLNVNREKMGRSAVRAGEDIQHFGKKVAEASHRAPAAAATHTVRGRVVNVAANDHLLTVTTADNQRLTVRTGAATAIRRHEVQVGVNELMAGDRVEVQYRDENGQHVATAITVEPST